MGDVEAAVAAMAVAEDVAVEGKFSQESWFGLTDCDI
jgi:hypothetical protein